MSDDIDENERKIDEYIARKSRFVSSKEFDATGKVLIFNSKRVNPDHDGKWGKDVQYIAKEPSGIEREVNTTALSLLNGLRSKLKERPRGTDVPLLIKKVDTKYVVEHGNTK